MILNKSSKIILTIAATVTALGTIGVPLVWAADQRYWSVSDQQQYEVRELKREVKRAELLCAKTQDDVECAFHEFLQQDLDELIE